MIGKDLILESLRGDRVHVESSGAGVGLVVVPPTPPHDDAIDLFQLGLNFSSITRAVGCLRGGPAVNMNDGKFKLSVISGTPTLEFEFEHLPRTYYAVRLGRDESSKFEEYLDQVLSGADGIDWVQELTKSTTTPRNAPCPCGSGKKFKKCCMGKDSSFLLPESLLFTAGATDPLVTAIVQQATKEPDLLHDSGFWDELGVHSLVSGTPRTH